MHAAICAPRIHHLSPCSPAAPAAAGATLPAFMCPRSRSGRELLGALPVRVLDLIFHPCRCESASSQSLSPCGLVMVSMKFADTQSPGHSMSGVVRTQTQQQYLCACSAVTHRAFSCGPPCCHRRYAARGRAQSKHSRTRLCTSYGRLHKKGSRKVLLLCSQSTALTSI